MIPKIIHQTWKTTDLEPSVKGLVDRCKRLHPQWTHKLWTDVDNRQLIEKTHPYFLKTYNNFPHNIQRVDAARCIILYEFGGVYLDLDFLILRNFNFLCRSREAVLCCEPDESHHIHRKPLIVSNAFMACPARHPFFKAVIDGMMTQQISTPDRNLLILESTGPFYITKKYEEWQGTGKVHLLDSKYFLPFSYQTVDSLRGKNVNFRQKAYDSYGVHLFNGSWWRPGVPNDYSYLLREPPTVGQPIPKKIHLTWKTKDLPPDCQENLNIIYRLHPGWDIKVWTDDEMLEFVKNHGPQYLNTYVNFPQMIQRCDMFRLLVIYLLGGIYLDMDITLSKSFGELPSYIDTFFPCEKVLSRSDLIKYGNRDARRIGNYAIGSIPRSPFISTLLDRINTRSCAMDPSRYTDKHNYILESTGPGILSTTFHDYVKTHPNHNITILYPEPDTGNAFHKGVLIAKVGNFGIHTQRGTWRNTQRMNKFRIR